MPQYFETTDPLRAHFSAHNDFLQVASTTGIPGLLAYVVASVIALVLVMESVRQTPRVGAAVGASLAALFFMAKFAPVTFSALLVGAVMLGLSAVRPTDPRPRRVGASLAVVALAGALFGISLLRFQADRHYLTGIRLANADKPLEAERAFAAALRMNPWEQKYAHNYVRAIGKLVMDPRSNLFAADTLLRVAQENIVRHPNDPEAYHTYAHALVVTYLRRGSDAIPFALQAIERACRLAPTFPPYAVMRDELALRIKGRMLDLPSLEEMIRRSS
jgi:O-antigen ligase